MLHRVRAHMRFPEGHWGPQWCYNQMVVRYGQATHIRPGEPDKEPPINEVDGDVFRCDLPLMNEAHAIDALATLSDHNVLGVTIPVQVDGDEVQLSWVERHTCDHDEEVRSGCVVVARNEGPA
jgi:hypothetical protein